MNSPTVDLPPRRAAVLPAKLAPPGAEPAQVPRDAIARQLDAAAHARLVLVRAPAGFGKTTAMRQMHARCAQAGRATAWLTLDAADNDVPRFLHCLAAAVQALEAAGPAGPGTGVDAIEALAREDRPFTLFLDDFEMLQSPAVLGLVRQLVEQLPARAQLVVGSRSLPELGLGRLRARGQLVEIDAGQLRFSDAEAERFFRLRGIALPREPLAQLMRKTEGWIGALWLVALALERHGPESDFVQRFSGSDRAVADYLAEDVLDHQPPEVRDFLLRTSILRTLDAAVCQALVPRTDCARMLRHLDAEHLFLTPLDADGQGYRYHSLFADFLRGQLAREQPDALARLHLAASGWYEAVGRPVPAIDHAIEGGDHPHALQLLGRHAESFLEDGRMRLLTRWFGSLPADRLATQPRLQVVAVWAECFTHGPWRALQRLEASGCIGSTDPVVQAHVNALQPLLEAMMDRAESACAIGRESLARLPSERAFADSALANAMAHIVSVMGEPHEAHRLLDAARRTQAGSIFNRMYTESLEGMLDLSEGRLRHAAARFRMAVSATPRAASYLPTHGNAWAGVLHAGVVYEQNDLDAADQLLNVYLPLARDVGLPDHVIASHCMRSRIAWLRGDVDAASLLLTELEYLGHDRQLTRVVCSARLEMARLLVLQGHGRAAQEMLARADDSAVWTRVQRLRLPAHEVDDLAIGRWRWALHFGDAAAAIDALDAAAHAAEAAARRHRALKLRTLLALAQWRAGRRAVAADTLAGVLRTTAQEGFMRLLLDEGPLLAPLLRLLQGERRRVDEAGPLFADHLAQLLAQIGEAAGDTDPDDAPSADPASTVAGLPTEALTRKELRVLQLLAEGYSNSAMAEKLFVSDSTVRTHLRNINLKLGAHSRTQAVALARRLGLMR